MTRCIVKFRDGYANIVADSMEEREGIVYVRHASELVGAFDLGALDAIYLSDKGGTE